jgi:15-hydroxyprostaglandin dehydrogenase (NAD)
MTKPNLAGWTPDKSKNTPMSTVIRAVEGFLNNSTQTRQVVECSVEDLYYHDQPEYSNEEVKWIISQDWMALATAQMRRAPE